MSLVPLSRSVFIELSSIITESYPKNEYGKKTEQISHLFHLPPFSKLIQTLANLEPLCSHGLLQGVYSYLNNIVKEFNTKRILCPQLLKEKDGIILRVLLVCGMMDQLLTMPTVEPWAYLLWQLLYFEIIHKEREEKYYFICYEALSTILFISTYKIHQRHNEKLHYRGRYKAYSHFCKKVRRECQDRPFPIAKLELSQLLPLPKRTFDYIVFDYYHNSVGKIQNISKINGSKDDTTSLICQNGFYPIDKIKLTTFEIIPSFFHENLGRRSVNYSFYQAQLINYNPKLDRNIILKLLFHKHNKSFPKAPIYGDDKVLKNSLFYKPPEIEYNGKKEKQEQSPLDKLVDITSKSISKSPINISKKQTELNIVNKLEEKINISSTKDLQPTSKNVGNFSNSHNQNTNYVNELQSNRNFNSSQQVFNKKDSNIGQNSVKNPNVSIPQPTLTQHANQNHLISQGIKNNTYPYHTSNSFSTSELHKATKRSLSPSSNTLVKKRKDNSENIPISSMVKQQTNFNNIDTNNILPQPVTNIYTQSQNQQKIGVSQQSDIPPNPYQQTNHPRLPINQPTLISSNVENFVKQQHIPQQPKTLINPQIRGNGIEAGGMGQNLQQGRQNFKNGFENTNIMMKDVIQQRNNFNQNLQHQQQYNTTINNQHLNNGPMMNQYQVNLRKEMIYRNNQQQNEMQFHDPNMVRLYNQGNPQQQQPLNGNQMFRR